MSSISSIGCVKIDFRAYGMLMQTMNLTSIKITTIPKWTEMSYYLSLVT
jgi:hypothetical protein